MNYEQFIEENDIYVIKFLDLWYLIVILYR